MASVILALLLHLLVTVCVCVCELPSIGSGLNSVVGCSKRNIDPSSGEKGKEFLDWLGTALASEDRIFAVNQYCGSACTYDCL